MNGYNARAGFLVSCIHEGRGRKKRRGKKVVLAFKIAQATFVAWDGSCIDSSKRHLCQAMCPGAL